MTDDRARTRATTTNAARGLLTRTFRAHQGRPAASPLPQRTPADEVPSPRPPVDGDAAAGVPGEPADADRPAGRGEDETAGHDGQVASRVLIADDDRAIRESLARALELEGYEVDTVEDGVAALARVRLHSFDALVLDVMMPTIDGLAVCQVLRAEGDRTPVLMLTARVETSDRVAGLDAGADDYLPKPFELDELLARLRALLRRAAPLPVAAGDGTSAETSTALRLDRLRVDAAARRSWWDEAELTLSKTEFDLLELLVRNTGIVLDHTTVYERIWGYDFGADSKNLAVYIGYLRRKLSAAGAPTLIHTVRGVGYTVRRP